MLEAAIEKNTAAVKELIATLLALGEAAAASHAAIGGPATTPAPQPEAKPAAASSKPAAAPEAKPAAAGVTYTYDDHIKPAINGLSKAKGREVALALVASFGVAKAFDLKPEQYADVLTKVKEAMEAEVEVA